MARHARYYMKFFGDQDGRLRSSTQQLAIEELTTEIDNFRAVWDWSVHQYNFILIEYTLGVFSTFFDARGWLQEGLDFLDRAKIALEKTNTKAESDRTKKVTYAHILVGQALLSFRLGQIGQAQTMLVRSMEILRPLQRTRCIGGGYNFPWDCIGVKRAITKNRCNTFMRDLKSPGRLATDGSRRSTSLKSPVRKWVIYPKLFTNNYRPH